MQAADRSGPPKVVSALRSWGLGLGIVTACSWARCVATGSPKVDENYPALLPGTAIFVALAAGWSLLVWGWWRLLRQPPPVEESRKLAFVGLLLTAPMLPMLSNDVFSVVAYGSVAAQGHDVYATNEALQGSAFYAWVGAHWSSTVCVYGPATLLAAIPAAALSGGSPWIALVLVRLTWLLPLAAAMELSFRRLRDRPAFHVMVWLNPLFLVEGPGQLHADMLGVAAVVAGVALAMGGRQRSSRVVWWGPSSTGTLLYAVAVLGKYTYLFAAPWFWLFGARSRRARIFRLLQMAAVLLGVGVILYAPFWRGLPTLTRPVRELGAMIPGGSIVEVVGHIVHVVRGGAVPPANLPPEVAVEMERQAKAPTWAVVSRVLRLVFVLVALRQLQQMLRNAANPRALALGTGALVVAAITLASHRFQSWYLMAALPFFGLECTSVWQRWWVVVVAASVATEFIHVLPRDAALLPVWSVVTNGAVVIAFVAWFRGRFLWPLVPPGLPAAPRDASSPPETTEPAAPSPPPAGS
jgi:hypothetical protein